MEVWIAEQWKTMAQSCIMGLIFGAGYDIIRVLQVFCGSRSNTQEKAPNALSPGAMAFWLYLVSDLGYMLLVTAASSIFLGEYNHGMLRWYLVLPCVGGMWLYRHTIGRLVMAASETIAGLLRWLLTRLFIRPIRWLLGSLAVIGKTILGTVAVFGKRQLCHVRMRYRMRHFGELVKIENDP